MISHATDNIYSNKIIDSTCSAKVQHVSVLSCILSLGHMARLKVTYQSQNWICLWKYERVNVSVGTAPAVLASHVSFKMQLLFTRILDKMKIYTIETSNLISSLKNFAHAEVSSLKVKRNFMARNFLAGDFLAHAVTYRDFMAGNFLAGDFLTRIRTTG